MLSQPFILIIHTIICSAFAASTNNIPVVVSPYKSYTSSEPTWLTSPFFRAGNEQVIKELTGNDKTPTYTFTFSSALPGQPNLAYGIKNYRGNDWFGQEFYQIKQIGLTPTTFSVSIQIYGATNLWILTVAYLAMDPTFPHHLNTFENVPINYTAGDIVNITDKQYYLTYYENYINYTAQAGNNVYKTFSEPFSEIYIVLYMTSLWIRADFRTSTYVNPVQFHVYTGVVNESFYFWNVTLRERALITNVHFSQIIFDSGDVESSKKYFIVYSTWINDIDGGFLQVPSEFVDNFIMGITAFQTVQGQCGFEYNWQFTTKQVNGVLKFGVKLQRSWTLTDTCGFSWSQSSIFYMQTWLCQDPYLYFNLTNSVCQTLCGGFNYQKFTGSLYYCEPCVNTLCYQCGEADKNICTDCASYLHYELIDGNCSCMVGYFPAASKCMGCWQGSAGCQLCTYNDGASGTLAYNSTQFTCTECNNTLNYFLTSETCTLCTISKCQFCLNLTDCQSCQPLYLLENGTKNCVINCSLVENCITCHQPMDSKQIVCDSCAQGYEVVNLTCQQKCGNGILISPQECDDGNKLGNDGCDPFCLFENNSICNTVNNSSNCSFCPIKTYADSNRSSCVPCTNYDCLTCDSTGNCLSCGIDSHRTLDNATNRCLPNDGYYQSGSNYVAEPCSNDCKICSGSNSSCLSCFSNRLLINSSCKTCGSVLGQGCSSCSTINSTDTCLVCAGLIVNNTCTPLKAVSLPEPDDKLAKMLLMILLPILLALCCCCLIIFCIWRRRNNEQNKVEEDDLNAKENLKVNDQTKISDKLNPIISKPKRRPKGFKGEIKKSQPKIQISETEGNQLSMDEFKDLKDVKIEVVRERSELGDRFDRSMASEQTESVEEDDDGNSKGGAY